MHGMIDLETLGTSPDTVILTLGAIKFDPYTNVEPSDGLYSVSYTHLTLPTILLV